MKKVDSNPHKETLEEEVKRLRKENAKLKSQKAAKEAKLCLLYTSDAADD